MNFTNLVRLSSVVENTFRSGSLTGINVCHDTNITVLFQSDLTELGRRGLVEVDILCLLETGKITLQRSLSCTTSLLH